MLLQKPGSQSIDWTLLLIAELKYFVMCYNLLLSWFGRLLKWCYLTWDLLLTHGICYWETVWCSWGNGKEHAWCEDCRLIQSERLRSSTAKILLLLCSWLWKNWTSHSLTKSVSSNYLQRSTSGRSGYPPSPKPTHPSCPLRLSWLLQAIQPGSKSSDRLPMVTRFRCKSHHVFSSRDKLTC